MDPTLAGLLAGWNNVEIARSFARFLTHPVRWLLTPRNQPRRVGTIDELKSGFFEGWIRYSDPVVIQGRLSRFAPIYFPIAYSPQVPGGVSSPDVLFSMQVYPNPAPAAFPLRHVDGGILAFLFPVSATGTPRITSPFHLDRMGYIDASGNSQSPIIPWSLAEPCVPVLLDRSQLRHLENITEITAVLAPLDPAIESALTGSHEDFVRLYYHGFYSSESYPDHGFMLNARKQSGGSVREIGEPSPFIANVAVELGFETQLTEEEMEDALSTVLRTLPEHPHVSGAPHRYQPAYHIPGGYKTVQIGRTPFLSHLTFERHALQLSMVVDSTSDMTEIQHFYVPSVASTLAEIRKRDPSIHLEVLFRSDPSLVRDLPLFRCHA